METDVSAEESVYYKSKDQAYYPIWQAEIINGKQGKGQARQKQTILGKDKNRIQNTEHESRTRKPIQ